MRKGDFVKVKVGSYKGEVGKVIEVTDKFPKVNVVLNIEGLVVKLPRHWVTHEL